MRVSYRCPVCGSPHDSKTEPGLRTLRELVRDELVSSVRGRADDEHISGVLAVLDDIEARMSGG